MLWPLNFWTQLQAWPTPEMFVSGFQPSEFVQDITPRGDVVLIQLTVPTPVSPPLTSDVSTGSIAMLSVVLPGAVNRPITPATVGLTEVGSVGDILLQTIVVPTPVTEVVNVTNYGVSEVSTFTDMLLQSLVVPTPISQTLSGADQAVAASIGLNSIVV